MGSKGPGGPVEPIEFDKLPLNPSLCTHILQKKTTFNTIIWFETSFANLIGSMEPI